MIDDKIKAAGLKPIRLLADWRVCERSFRRITDQAAPLRQQLIAQGIEPKSLRPVDLVRPATADEELYADEDGDVVAAHAWRLEVSDPDEGHRIIYAVPLGGYL